MAKRKSTDKTSSKDVEDKIETSEIADAPNGSDDQKPDLESTKDTVADAVEAVDTYAPADGADGQDAVAAEPSEDVVDTTDEGAVDKGDVVENPDDIDAGSEVDNHLSEEEAERLLVDAETVEGKAQSSEILDDTDPKPVPVAPQVVRETVVERKGGFVPMFAGGVVAAALGYGVAAYVSQDVWPFASAAEDTFEADMRAMMDEQSATLSAVSDRLTALEGVEPPVVDLTPVEDGLAAAQGTASEIATRLDDVIARIDTLERQPMEQAVSPEAIAAYERALADLQADVEAQRAEVLQMAQEAMQAEDNAEEQAKLAAARAALADVTTALETGAGFASAVDVLSENGVEVPEAVVATSQDGIATLGSLIETFPDAARAALVAARTVETEGAQGANRVTSFFANQLGARSVAPREGDDPDAILSRSEAALRSGDLGTAITELTALPEVAQSAMADWQSRAQTRLEAKTAADALVQQLLQE